MGNKYKGYLCSVFKDNLLDSLDKPPDLIKTIFRITEIIHTYLDVNISILKIKL